MVGIIGASDETPLTISSGNKEMHPLLISLVNINAGVHMKATSHSFTLVAYLPILKFLGVSAPVQAALTARVYHISLNTVFYNLKIAKRNGVVMPDPWGQKRFCHTPLVSMIADLPEQHLQSCVLSNRSVFTTAVVGQYGDDHDHPHCTRDHTLNLIKEACIRTDPKFVGAFVKTCQDVGLNGVHQPFWRDWGNGDPSYFLTPDALHAWHKFIFDHPLKWIINIMGGDELDRCMAALQPHVGVRHW
jgi:hypothetical protein